ncbi:MAG: DUF222 domain-containing protein [Candidatus Nanopelagicales bacterium]
MNSSVVDAWDVMLSRGDPLEVAKAAEAVIGFCHAQQLRALHQVYVEAELGSDPDGVVVDPTPPEVACAMVWTPGAAASMVDVAVDVVEDLPVVLAALAEGRIDLGKVREITRATLGLSRADRQGLAERAIDYAATRTRGQLRPWLTRQVDRIDPDAADRRRKAARKRRRVSLIPEPDGMATLSAYLTAEEATACMASIRARSTRIDGSRDASQADTFIELLTGVSAAEQIPIAVIMTDDGAQIEGYGPIADAHAEDLLRRLELPSAIIRLTPPQFRIGYAPTVKMRRYVQVRDRHCRFPGCRRTARSCDLDHIVAYPAGPTDVDNLQPLCRTHHRVKTHGGWHVERGPNNTMIWTSPRGKRYTSHPDDP